MFKFKKSMEGISEEEKFECSCCGAIEEQGTAGVSKCSSSCGTKNNSCCGPVGDTKDSSQEKML